MLYLKLRYYYTNILKGRKPMGKGIYTYYKERLIEIGGNNKCLYLKSIVRKGAYDIGRILEARDAKVAEFVDFLHSNKKYPFPLICNTEKKAILQNLDIEQKAEPKNAPTPLSPEEEEKLRKKAQKEQKALENQAIEQEITKLRELKREIEEIEKETGRYELYIGYPFVFGTLLAGPHKTVIKAPLMLFPVRIEIPDENTVELTLNEAEKIHINPALIFAYAQSKRINIDDLELEFDDISDFKGIGDIIKYLEDAHIRINWAHSKNVFAYSRFKEPTEKELAVRYAAVLGRFPLSNSIYSDYSLLEKKKLTNDAVEELLRTSKQKPKKQKKAQKNKKPKSHYHIKMLDYAQSNVVSKVDERGNMVIYGPPGTGKSQTIVNVISDALSKKKRVLVVSQKKAALDVVYNRLAALGRKAMYINDECKEKRFFYERCLAAHTATLLESAVDLLPLEEEYDSLEKKIRKDEFALETIYSVLNEERPFGLSLSEMYSSSHMISNGSADHEIYTRLTEDPEMMALRYSEIKDALFVIKAKNLDRLYYNFIEDKEKNPLIDHMQPDIDIHTINEVKAELSELQKSRKGFFNTAKYPYYRQVMAYFKELAKEKNLDILAKQECKFRYPGKLFTKKYRKEIKEQFNETIAAIDKFVKKYDFLHKVLTLDGYISVIDNVLRGNVSYVKFVGDALENYIAQRDITKLLESLDKNKILILNFAYANSKNYANYTYILDKIMELRIYHEITRYEEICKDDLAKTVDFQNITERIYKQKEQQLELANKISAYRNSRDYETLYNEAKNNKDYLYQISKKQKFWPVRKTMEVYGDFVLSLFPCWLLSPENVSCLLPLTKNMFDLVIFDEASQVFIESTIPTIYRGKNIVIAGDSKQLRPSRTFMKRYLGGDPDAKEDYAVQAALEVDSLLDLAVSRYESANLTYHYRSKYSELIDFSNSAFYSSKLQIAPNISKSPESRPIERYKVLGKWIDRKNQAEAKKIVELLSDIFKTRKNNESIGIITFNADQQTCIADCIDKAAAKDPDFRSYIIKETHRVENGEDTSLFIKNLENVQGDERDIIIFSIGYAENAEGKVYTNFGSLSADGGENRLNVAITRAKTKIIVVTSIEPEELKVDTAKNKGPKLLKKYLEYVRSVAKGDVEETRAILSELDPVEAKPEDTPPTSILSIEEQIKERLEKLGYTVDLHLGNKNNRITLAIYDEKLDRYLVGVELDRDAFAASKSAMERDVYKPRFLRARGWNVIRVWSRDFWLYPQKVIKTIVSAAEKNKK